MATIQTAWVEDHFRPFPIQRRNLCSPRGQEVVHETQDRFNFAFLPIGCERPNGPRLPKQRHGGDRSQKKRRPACQAELYFCAQRRYRSGRSGLLRTKTDCHATLGPNGSGRYSILASLLRNDRLRTQQVELFHRPPLRPLPSTR